MGCVVSLLLCHQSKRDRIEIIDAELLEFRIAIRNLKRGIEEAKDGIAFYEMELRDLERERLDLCTEISAEEEIQEKRKEEKETKQE